MFTQVSRTNTNYIIQCEASRRTKILSYLSGIGCSPLQDDSLNLSELESISRDVADKVAEANLRTYALLQESLVTMPKRFALKDSLIFPRTLPYFGEKETLPTFYRKVSAITLALSIASLIFMFFDQLYALTPIGASAYVIFSLCCLSLFITNKIAIREWRKANESKRKKEWHFFLF